MRIQPATAAHFPQLVQLDKHIEATELSHLISRNMVLVAVQDGKVLGWLRWNLFWDSTPFMNMLYILEPCRGTGLGHALVQHWEEDLKASGYHTVMTSTASDEYAQHFYRKLGYETIGGFTPFGEAYELILAKRL